jgi:putative hydrolase of HD superfamily
MEPSVPPRIVAQMSFLLAADALKGVNRSCSIADGTRYENSAEHSWHVTLMALVLAEHCPHPVDLFRVLQILTIHDLVEVYAGDTVIYDEVAVQSQPERERAAAERLFSVLPEDQAALYHRLWQEFEARESPEARYARAIDALAPTWIHWGEHANPKCESLTSQQILSRKREILEPYPELFDLLKKIVFSALNRGLIAA